MDIIVIGINDMYFFLGLIGGYFAPQTFVILEKPGCAICEYVINDLQTIIGSNRSEAQIEAGLEKVNLNFVLEIFFKFLWPFRKT